MWCAHTRTCRGLRTKLGALLSCALPYFFRQDFPLNLEFADSAKLSGQLVLRLFLSAYPSARFTHRLLQLAFGLADPNSGSHVCVANTNGAIFTAWHFLSKGLAEG